MAASQDFKDEILVSASSIASTAPSPISPSTVDPESQPRILPYRYRWRPTFWRVQPLLGMLAIAVAIVCLMVSLAILKASNGQITETWYFQPTVYLAIATALSNVAIQCALAIAAPISWWHKALRGTTIKDLEHEWQATQSFPRSLVFSIRHHRMFGTLSIASLATALVLIDGPLLQRASSVKRASVVDIVPVNISVVAQLPEGFSAQVSADGLWEYMPAAWGVFHQHINQEPIIVNASFCVGTCSATIKAPGYSRTSCWNRSWDINETMLRDADSLWGIGPQGVQGGSTGMSRHPLVFSQAFPKWGPDYCTTEGGREPLIVSAGTANYQNCEGQFTFRNCTFLPAIFEYDVKIVGNVLTYKPTTSNTSMVALADDYCHNSSALATTGFLSMMQPYVSANGSLGTWIGPLADQNLLMVYNTQSFTSFSMQYLDIAPSASPCTMKTIDPMDDIVDAFNDLLVRSAVRVGSWANATEINTSPFPVHQIVQANRTREQVVFHSDDRWFAGAAVVQLLAVLLILPAYWGWWRIGVELSLSPFHTAHAFDAPLFSKVNSAAGARGIVDEMGDTSLQLGAVGVRCLHHEVGMEKMGSCTCRVSRIGMDDPERMTRPCRGQQFAK